MDSHRPRVPEWALLLTLLLAACDRSPAGDPGEWPRFRGPGGLGVSPAQSLPVRWGPDSAAIRWRTRLPGAGNSSPIVSHGKVFVTATYGEPQDDPGVALQRSESDRVVLALDFASGEVLWRTRLFRGPMGRRHWTNTHAAPTPVTDGRHLFVSFDSHLAALDFDGKVVWQRDIDPDYYKFSRYGVSSSPVLTERAVILLQDKEDAEYERPGWIAAFDKRNGEELWRDQWDHTCCSYTTPLVVEGESGQEVWSSTTYEIVSYDAVTGAKRWTAKHPTLQTVPSPVLSGDLLCVPGGMHRRGMAMFRVDPSDAGRRPVKLWTDRRRAPEISTPVVYGGRVYAVKTGGLFYALDAETGEEVARRRLPRGNYLAALVAGDGKLYVYSETGLTVVLDIEGEKPEVLARNRLPGGSGASPALAGDSILLRSAAYLYRIGSPPAGEARSRAAGG